MATTLLTGIITKIDPIEKSKEGRDYQRVLITEPAKSNAFGEKVNEDQVFEILIYGKEKIAAFWSKHDDKQPTKKVKVECYVNSRVREQDGRTFYNLSLTAKEVQFVQ